MQPIGVRCQIHCNLPSCPTSSTIPETSTPMILLAPLGGGYSPFRWRRSIRLRANALTCNRESQYEQKRCPISRFSTYERVHEKNHTLIRISVALAVGLGQSPIYKSVAAPVRDSYGQISCPSGDAFQTQAINIPGELTCIAFIDMTVDDCKL